MTLWWAGNAEMKPSEFRDLTDNNVSAYWHALGMSIDTNGDVWKRARTGGQCTNTTYRIMCHGPVKNGRCDQNQKHYCKQDGATRGGCECTALNFCNISTCHETAPVKQWLAHFPVTGINKAGCPVYDSAQAGWWDRSWQWPPPPFNETIMGPLRNLPVNSSKWVRTGLCNYDDPRSGYCSGRLQYISEVDTMWVAGFTNDRPNVAPYQNIGEPAGSRLCKYEGFKKSGFKAVPSPSLCFDLPVWINRTNSSLAPPNDPNGNLTHSLNVLGDCVFVALLGDGIKLNSSIQGASNGGGALVLVYQASTWTQLGYLNPNRNRFLGPSGWLDLPFGTSAAKLDDGR